MSTSGKKKREGKVLRVLPSGCWVPRNQIVVGCLSNPMPLEGLGTGTSKIIREKRMKEKIQFHKDNFYLINSQEHTDLSFIN